MRQGLVATLVGRYRRLNLRGRFIMMFCLVGIVPLLVTVLYASSTLSANTREHQMLAARMGYEQTHSFLSDKLYRILRMCDVIALDASLQECLYRHDPENYSMQKQIADRAILRTFLVQKKDDLDIYNVNLYVRDEWVYSHSGDMIYGLKSIEEEVWYESLLRVRYQALFCPPSYFSGGDMVAVARRVRNLENLNHVEAVLRIDFPLDEIERILRQGCTVEGSVSMVITGNGQMVASSHAEPAPLDNLASIINGAGLASGFISSGPGADTLVQCSWIPHTDWLLLTVLSEDAMSAVSRQAWYSVVLLMITLLMPALVIIWFMLANMSQRLYSLDIHMQNVREGTLEPKSADPNDDEIGRMTVSYNYMIDRIATLIHQQFELGRTMRSTELLALQSQINPHFLYNTLDMLNWLSRLGRNDDVQEVLQALADFYRSSLSSGDDIIPLSTEIRIVESYMKIQKFRYGDTIGFSMEITPEALSCVMPKITLQPLVENALLHGIEPNPSGGGHIMIRGKIEGDILMLEIADDGVGMPPDTRASVLVAQNGKQKRSGYGLYNIEERLRLFFGVADCIFITSGRDGTGTVVSIRVPARQA